MLILDGKSLLPKSEFKSMMQSINQVAQDYIASTLSEEKMKHEHQAKIEDLLEQQLKTQEEQVEILKEQSDGSISAYRPAYVNQLVEDGLVYIDGVTALAGLDKIADYLLNHSKIDFLSPELLLQFRQKTGEQFSINTARESVKRAKTKESKTN